LYLKYAQELECYLIAPLQPLLAHAKAGTLVFVPGGALRTIPLGVLHDGQRFLIERYAVAVAPGLTLLEPVALTRAPGAVLLGGVSEARQEFPPLPFVPRELSQVRQLFPGEELLDAQFELPRLRREFTDQPYRIVHLATHGRFDRDASKTFILTYHDKLSLNELERLLKPSKLRNEPVELLTLSACQTAAGDDRAALGLAGVAVKAGARSALATLWCVNDEASARLVTDFYAELKKSPTLNKAQALQAAQRRFLTDVRYGHPYYWAPFLLIGNWL
jgi:CHAT domain-containing protein